MPATPRVELHRESYETLAAGALYLALTLVLVAPLSFHPAGFLFSDSPDTHLFMWTLAWDTHAFVHQPLRIFDANIFYPDHNTLAYSENLIGSALFAAPVLWLTRNPVLAVNVVSLLSCVLCGVGAYMLARRLHLSAAAALVGGVVFAFCPPRLFRFDQLHLAVVQWIPFTLAFTHGYLESGRPRDLWLAIAFFTLQTLSSGHGAVFLIVALITLAACRFALRGTIAPMRVVRDAGIVGALLLVPAVLVFVPYQIAQMEVGLKRGLDAWNTTPQSFIASPTHLHIWLLSLITNGDINERANAYLFPGYVPLTLAAAGFMWRQRTTAAQAAKPPRNLWRAIGFVLDVGLVFSLAAAATVAATGPLRVTIGGVARLTARSARRPLFVALVFAALRLALVPRAPVDPFGSLRRAHDRWRRFVSANRDEARVAYFAIAVVSIGLSLGPPIGLWPLVYWLPGFNFIRVPSRFMTLGVLGIAILAAFGFDWLTRSRPAFVRRMAAGLTVVLLGIEFAAIPLAGQPYRLEYPAGDLWLARQRKPFVVVELPIRSPRDQTTFMLNSMAHWQKTVNGYSGIEPPSHVRLYRELRDFPTDTSVRQLRAIGVTYVVLHRPSFSSEEWTAIGERAAKFSDALKPEFADAESRVYSVAK